MKHIKIAFIFTLSLGIGSRLLTYPTLAKSKQGTKIQPKVITQESDSENEEAIRPATLEDLQKEIEILKRQKEIDKEAYEAKSADSPVVTASPKDGFQIKSPNDSFNLKIRALVQSDSRLYLSQQKSSSTPEGFTLRRVRPIIEASLYSFADLVLTPEFGGSSVSLQDAYIDLKFSPSFTIRSGRFKVPFGLERLQSSSSTLFTELGLPSNFTPNFDQGIQLFGDALDSKLAYSVAVINGPADNASLSADVNNSKDITGRLFFSPFRDPDSEYLHDLGIGVAASYGDKRGTTLGTFKTPSQIDFFSYTSPTVYAGDSFRLSPQFYYFSGQFGILGEYILNRHVVAKNAITSTLEHNSWQIETSYYITGETPTYKGISPLLPFDPANGAWGAVELKARYGQLNIDPATFANTFSSLNTSASKAEEWGLGVNWYLNKNIKVQVDFEQTKFEGGATGGNRDTETAIVTRVQLAY